MKALLFSLLATLLLCASLAMAIEPINLDVQKRALMQYHDSGAYAQDLATAMHPALAYLKQRLATPVLPPRKKLAIVLDIDETSLSNYTAMVKQHFGGTLDEIMQEARLNVASAITPTLALFRLAKENHVAVFFITGREEEERISTVEALENAGYANWDGLFFRDGIYKSVPAATYKTAMRKQLNDKGYDIILNIGDQTSDLAGAYADSTVKLPNPFYLIP